MSETKLMKVSEAAERLRISSSKCYELVERCQLAHFRIGGSIRISEEQIQEYLDSCRHGRRQEDWSEKSNPQGPVKLKHIKL